MQSAASGLNCEGGCLSAKRIKVDTLNLERGMYVALLDRPWLETPFLFHGFEVREDSELDLLRKFCKHVYVDPDRGSLSRDRVLAAHRPDSRPKDPFAEPAPRRLTGRSLSGARGLLARLLRLDRSGRLAARLNGGKRYSNSVPTREEAPRAAHAYGLAVDAMNEVLDDVRRGAGIRIDRLKQAVEPIIDSVLRNQDAMAWLVYLRKRDEYAWHHSIASCVWAVILGRHLDFDRLGLQTLAIGGLLLDVGKTLIPDSITNKEGPLTEQELEIMRMHVAYGVELARKTPGMSNAILAMISSHHERHDGSGYPEGLAGSDIPVYGRISGLVDCYDAMTTKRSYADAKSSYIAIRELNLMAGTKFQRDLVEQFVQALGMFPTGTIVELNTGEVGIVIEQNRVRRLRPKLMLLLDSDKQRFPEAQTLDLDRFSSDEGHRSATWIVQGHEPGAFGINPKDYFL
jgi:HD-GYP domain-containing protein (c-di-GMP phosphodiesterase class II)